MLCAPDVIFPPNNTGFDECWGYCISCNVDLPIFHRNKDRTPVDIHRACCKDRAITHYTPLHLTELWWVWQTRGQVPGWSRQLVTQTPWSEQTTVNKHSPGSRFVILAKSWLFWGVCYWSNLCLYHAKLLAIDAWKSRQKILRKGEVYCSEKSTRQSQRPNNWRV